MEMQGADQMRTFLTNPSILNFCKSFNPPSYIQRTTVEKNKWRQSQKKEMQVADQMW